MIVEATYAVLWRFFLPNKKSLWRETACVRAVTMYVVYAACVCVCERVAGVGNNCAPDEFVMAAYAIEETDLYFSSCSADNFNDNVANLGCLSSTEPDVDWQTSTSTTTLPSVLLSMVNPTDQSLAADWTPSTGSSGTFTIKKKKKAAFLKPTRSPGERRFRFQTLAG